MLTPSEYFPEGDGLPEKRSPSEACENWREVCQHRRIG